MFSSWKSFNELQPLIQFRINLCALTELILLTYNIQTFAVETPPTLKRSTNISSSNYPTPEVVSRESGLKLATDYCFAAIGKKKKYV